MTVVRDVTQAVVHAVVGGVLGDSGGGAPLTRLEEVQALFVNGGGFHEGFLYDITDATANNVAIDGTGADVTDGALLGRRVDLSGNNNHLSANSDGDRETWDLISSVAYQTFNSSAGAYTATVTYPGNMRLYLSRQEIDVNSAEIPFAGSGAQYIAIHHQASSSLSTASSAGSPTNHINNGSAVTDNRDALYDALDAAGLTVPSSGPCVQEVRNFDPSTWSNTFRVNAITSIWAMDGPIGSMILIPESIVSGDADAHAACYNFIADQIGETFI